MFIIRPTIVDEIDFPTTNYVHVWSNNNQGMKLFEMNISWDIRWRMGDYFDGDQNIR